jgi:hypothetical protein
MGYHISIKVSLASGAEVRFVPSPEKYSTLDAGRFCRSYEWAYPVQKTETASYLGNHSIASSEKKPVMTPCFRIKY